MFYEWCKGALGVVLHVGVWGACCCLWGCGVLMLMWGAWGTGV